LCGIKPQLRGFIQSLAPDFATADDVLQECFLTISAKAHEFEPGFLDFVALGPQYCPIQNSGFVPGPETACLTMLSEDVLGGVVDFVRPVFPNSTLPEAQNNAIESLRLCLGRLARAAREIVRLRCFSQWGPLRDLGDPRVLHERH